MPSKIRYFASLGMYKEEGELRIARVLTGFIFIFIITSLFIIGIGLAQGDPSVIYPMMGGIFIILIPLFFLYCGRLSTSSYLTIVIFIALVTLFSTLGYGIRDYAILGYPTAIVFAGLAEKRRGLNISTILTVLALGWLVLGEKYGYFSVPQVYEPTWFDLLLTIQGILMLAFVVDMLVTNLVVQLTQLRQELAQRKQAEEALEHSKGLIQSINDNLDSGMVYQVVRKKDGSRKFTYVSDAVRKMYGATPLEVMKNPDLIYSRVHPDDRARVLEEEEEANRTLSVFRSEVRMINPDGSMRWSSFVSNPQLAEGGATYWNGIELDVTRRKQIEEALRQSRSLIESINNNLVAGMIYQVALHKDGARKFTYLSEGVQKFYGASPAEVMDDPAIIYSSIHPEDLPRLVEAEENAIQAMSTFRAEARVINPDGSVRWSSFASKPREAENGVIYWDAIEVDITERKHAEEVIQKANQQLSEQLEEIQRLQAELHEQILRDPLTGLYNRRYLDEALRHEVSRAEREKKPFSLIVMDIDHFKQINDTYGHPVGDLFLVQIGNLLKQHVRGMDTACRFGGEEFVLMMPGANVEDAFHRAEEIRLKCAEIHISHESHALRVTISAGIASYPIHSATAEKLLIKADKAMYRSKQNGRNRTTVWDE